MLEKIKYLTAGESHGKGLLGIVEGIPSHLEITEEYIVKQLSRRQHGHGRSNRMKIESDYAELYCGVRHGITLGGPIGLIINNNDNKNWKDAMSVERNTYDKKITLPRPGHADLAGAMKFGFDDIRNVIERSSARETAMRVAIAAICRRLLDEANIIVCSRVIQILDIKDLEKPKIDIKDMNSCADKSPVRCINDDIEKKMVDAIDSAKEKGDSVGGVIEVICSGLPYGLGSYTQWDKKLQSKIAETLLSINAFKAIEFGMGTDIAALYGSQVHDEIGYDQTYTRKTNNAGGIEGGMSNAQRLVIRLTMKPIPTLIKPLDSVDILSHESKKAHKERTDSCAVPAASVIAENLLCIVIADTLLSKFGGDSMNQFKMHMKDSAKY